MDNQDTVYVIYLDNEIFNKGNQQKGHKCAYFTKGRAKAVVTSESRRMAHVMFDEAKTKQCWYEIGEENKQEWINKARERFEIKEFIERK